MKLIIHIDCIKLLGILLYLLTSMIKNSSKPSEVPFLNFVFDKLEIPSHKTLCEKIKCFPKHLNGFTN